MDWIWSDGNFGGLWFNPHKGTNHFLVELNETREADGLSSQSLDARSERQVVTLDTRFSLQPARLHNKNRRIP